QHRPAAADHGDPESGGGHPFAGRPGRGRPAQPARFHHPPAVAGTRGATMIRIAAVVAGAAVLAGCALLSTPDPVQLYRFGGDSGAAPAAAPDAALAAVSLRRIQFPEAVGDDRLLAVTG